MACELRHGESLILEASLSAHLAELRFLVHGLKSETEDGVAAHDLLKVFEESLVEEWLFNVVIKSVVSAIDDNDVELGALVGGFLDELIALLVNDRKFAGFHGFLHGIVHPEELLAHLSHLGVPVAHHDFLRLRLVLNDARRLHEVASADDQHVFLAAFVDKSLKR